MEKERQRYNKLTSAQEKFIQELIKGSTQRAAYKKAYPKRRNWKDGSIDCEASKLFKKPQIRQRYDELLQKFRSREEEKSRWSREEAIKTLRFVVDKNKQEIERIQDAAEEELELLAEQIKIEPERANALIKEMIQKRKSRRISSIHNAGIVSAVAELNKMQGYNEENINLNGVVTFVGEDELED